MKREVFVLMQGMSHTNLSFKSILCMCISYNSKEVTLRGHKKGAWNIFYTKWYIFHCFVKASYFTIYIHATRWLRDFVILKLKNFLILSFSYPPYCNNISLLIPWGYIIKCLPIPMNRETLTQFHLSMFILRLIFIQNLFMIKVFILYSLYTRQQT